MFLLIDNYDSFTFNLVQAFMQQGRDPKVIKNDDPALPGMALDPALTMVCISPGPGRPERAGLCLDFLQQLPKHIPVLGVCLGHQVLGHFAGVRVEVADRIMHGKTTLAVHDGTGLFQGLASPMQVGRYHSLLVRAEEKPDLLEITARSADDEREVMAMRFIDRPWAGVQFHPESVLSPEGARLLANFPSGLIRSEAGTDAGAGTDLRVSAVSAVKRKGAPIQMAAIMEDLAEKRDLSPDAAASAFSRLMDGELPPSLAGAFLLGLRAKGETAAEVAEAVGAVLARAVPVPAATGNCIDIVGTGGDNKSSFNCSTATSLTLAGMGHKVLKHGNRSVSSKCGSADVLEQIGLSLDTPPEQVARSLENDRFVFLFAPRYHPAFKHVMPIRRELGVRTLFNILGPLVNPAHPTHHFLGAPSERHIKLMAEVLARTSNGAGGIVCGAGGYDELTPMGEAAIWFVQNGKSWPGRLDPARYGFEPCDERELAVSGPEDAANALRALLSGTGPKAMADMMALNLGFALYLLGMGDGTAPDDIDSETGYDHTRMAASMAQAKLAVAQGAGRRFIRA